MKVEIEWKDINKEEPIDKKGYGTEYLVSVTCDTWDKPKTMIMSWHEDIIRGKLVKRWKWKDRLKIDAWVVTHWAELPEPVSEKM